MIDQLLRPRTQSRQPDTARLEMVRLLRAMVLAPPANAERLHALFINEHGAFAGDAPMGIGRRSRLSLRMREVFQTALAMDARGMIIAHNHPSGQCRPSVADIENTQRLQAVAKTLDIELMDHLIFTSDAVYSMRAGGNL